MVNPSPATTSGLLKALVIDDDVFICGMISDALANDGFAVQSAANGSEGITQMGFGPHVVITDMYMPRGDGLDFCRELRQTPRWRNIPVIILTAGTANEKRVRQAASLTDVRVIHKPCNLHELIATAAELAIDYRASVPVQAVSARRLIGEATVPLYRRA